MSQTGPAVPQREKKSSSRQLPARALSAIHSHPWRSRVALLAYAAVATLPHAQVQWATNEVAIHIGMLNLYRLSAAIILMLAAILTAVLFRRVWGQAEGGRILGLWFLTVALIVGAWSGLTANNVELIHYPQYFPEGILFAAMTLSPPEALAWVVLFGGLDESYQYWVLPRTRVSLLDFNDIYMDLLGGAAGIVFAMAFLRRVRQPDPGAWRRAWKRPGPAILLAMIGMGAVLWSLGLMLIERDKSNPHYWFALGDFRAPSFWAQVVENGPKHYHTFTPVEGVVVILATIVLYAALSRKIGLRADRG